MCIQTVRTSVVFCIFLMAHTFMNRAITAEAIDMPFRMWNQPKEPCVRWGRGSKLPSVVGTFLFFSVEIHYVPRTVNAVAEGGVCPLAYCCITTSIFV